MKKFAIFLSLCFLVLTSVFITSCNQESTTTYDMSLELTENKLNGKETVKFTNSTDTTITKLKFNLFANAYRKEAKYSPISSQYNSIAYYNGINYGCIEIFCVKVDGKNCEYSISGEDQNILSIDIEELFPNESVCVEIEFCTTIPKVISRLGENNKTINLSTFYPILCGIDENGFYECVYYSNGDPFFSDVATYNVSITCDSSYIVATTGKITKSKGDTSKKTYYILGDNLRSFAMTLSKGYKTIIDKIDDVEISYYYYDDSAPQECIDVAKKAIKTFSELFGKYPFETLSVAQTMFTAGGMEYPSLVYISDDLERQSYFEVIVHETAHQWWQSAVGNNEVEYGFLDEGLCEYSTVLFYENNDGYSMDKNTMIKSAEKTYKTFCNVYDKLFGNVNTSMKRSLKDFSSEYEYVNIAYIKSVIMYDTLRSTIGDDTFFKCLKRYYKDYKFKNATPDDLMGIFEKYVKDSEGFLSSYILGKAII